MNNNKSLGFNIEIPSDVMSEQSLIASILLGGNKLFKDMQRIDKSMFYRVAHSLIWDAYKAIDDSGKEIDIVTVNEELTKRNALESCGGLGYIMQCAELLPTTGHCNSYADIVWEYHKRREIIFAAEYASKRASIGEDPVDSIVTDLNNSVTFTQSGKATDDLSQLIFDLTHSAINRKEDKIDFSISSGFTDIDHITGGWRDGELIIVGGRPSMGKSSLGLQYAWNAAVALRNLEQRTGVLVVSAEMSKAMVTARMLSIYSGVDSQAIQTKKLSSHEMDCLATTSRTAKTLTIDVMADQSVTLQSIRDGAKNMRKKAAVG